MSNKKSVYNVILVDDVIKALEGLEMFLDQFDHINVIEKYTDGLQVVESTLLNRTDLILMDIEMPGMNGLEAAKLISYNYPGIKLVAVTMYQHRLYLEDIVKSGFHGFVEKGKIIDNLMVVVEDVMEEKRSYSEINKYKK